MSGLLVCFRTIRRRFLFLILLSSIAVFLLGKLVWVECFFCYSEEESNILHLRKLNQPFNWESDQVTVQGSNTSDFIPTTCRNSLQGKAIIVDDKGYLCSREELLGSGCCNINTSLGRFLCESCDPKIECCIEYEYCISCCLRREQKPVLQEFLQNAADNNNVLFVSVSDHFELCLAKCRTSSSSVQHENTYRNKKRKFCYGKDAPPTVSSMEP
ncbi:UPF0454 protein C12orf49 homolog [Eurytemora carolleeae]|uniref:UPF0454 protein C12orf49 homolog n=1 Tax=Eurytemora carolleeae TaxID=1294199 RepID=UPI000C75E878|nr:UPF0454 protein C12orf49 homolog [Eurytemora carolleeae]|eukprot:XP_023345266.1 UPF0454 protein C12orf49 homolog [Eurytemora affinis]